MPEDSNSPRSQAVRPLVVLPPLLSGLIQAAPDFTLAAGFLVTWLSPYRLGHDAVKHLVLVVLLEFIVIHSAGFMGVAALGAGSAWKRLLVIVGFGLFYSLFTGAFSLAFHTAWPFLSFWCLTGNRMLNVLISPVRDLKEANIVMGGWALTVAAYLLWTMLTALLPVPRLGITPEVVAAQAFSGGGLWIDQPQTAIALGLFYFLTVGIGELVLTTRGGRADASR